MLVWISCISARFSGFVLWIRFALVVKDFLDWIWIPTESRFCAQRTSLSVQPVLRIFAWGEHNHLLLVWVAAACSNCVGVLSPSCIVHVPIAVFSDNCSGVRGRRCDCISSCGREDTLKKENAEEKRNERRQSTGHATWAWAFRCCQFSQIYEETRHVSY